MSKTKPDQFYADFFTGPDIPNLVGTYTNSKRFLTACKEFARGAGSNVEDGFVLATILKRASDLCDEGAAFAHPGFAALAAWHELNDTLDMELEAFMSSSAAIGDFAKDVFTDNARDVERLMNETALLHHEDEVEADGTKLDRAQLLIAFGRMHTDMLAMFVNHVDWFFVGAVIMKDALRRWPAASTDIEQFKELVARACQEREGSREMLDSLSASWKNQFPATAKRMRPSLN